MYTPPLFKQDRAASLAFAEERGFGMVCAWTGTRPIASSLPFYLRYADDGTVEVLFHVARQNPLAKFADGVTSWLLATPRRVERFVAFFFAGSAASYMSIQVVLCRLHAATGVRFPAYALGG